MTLHAEADELYGIPLEEFTASRNARAKEVRAGGDRALAAQIGKLAKPRRVAWVLNMLVRQLPGEVDDLIELGEQIRTAQAHADRDELRTFDRSRRELTRELTRQARAIADGLGQKVDDPLAAEVENTLRAAMADPAGGAALRTGLLVDGFGSTGFEPVDVDKVVAVPDAVSIPAESRVPPPPDGRRLRAVRTLQDEPEQRPKQRPRKALEKPPDPDTSARQQAQAALDEALHALGEADRARERAAAGHTEATSAREELESERVALQERFRTLDRDIARAHRVEDKTQRERDRAERAYADAQRIVERAEGRAAEH